MHLRGRSEKVLVSRDDVVRLVLVLGLGVLIYVYLALPGSFLDRYVNPALLVGLAVGARFARNPLESNDIKTLEETRRWLLVTLGFLGLVLAYAVVPSEGGPLSSLSPSIVGIGAVAFVMLYVDYRVAKLRISMVKSRDLVTPQDQLQQD